MIVDTSAVVSVLLGEPEARRYEHLMTAASPCRMSVANYLEAVPIALKPDH